MLAIRADGNAKIGMGHIMRCFSIAKEVQRRDEEVCFVVSPDTDTNALIELEIPFEQLKITTKEGWSANEMSEWLVLHDINKVLLDSYRVTPQDFQDLKEERTLYYIDDCYAFDYQASAIINYNIEAIEERYSQTIYLKRKLYLGVSYLPLREELCKVIACDIRRKLKMILISTGSTDPNHLSSQIIQALNPSGHSNIHFEILVGSFFDETCKKELERMALHWENVSLLPWGQDMAAIYSGCDLVIAPGATILYEALSLNVPCISFEFTDNHHLECVWLDKMGLVPWAGNYQSEGQLVICNIGKIFKKSLKYETRMKQYKKYSCLFDRRGTERIVDIIMENI